MAQFQYLGAEVCPTGDQALLRPVDLAFVLDEAFVVARVFSYSVIVAGGRGHRRLEHSLPSRLGTRVGWEGAHPVGCKLRVGSLSGAIVGSGLGLILPWPCLPYPQASLLWEEVLLVVVQGTPRSLGLDTRNKATLLCLLACFLTFVVCVPPLSPRLEACLFQPTTLRQESYLSGECTDHARKGQL